MVNQLKVFLCNIDEKLANQLAKTITKGLGNCDEGEEFSEYYVTFEGYLIGKVIISLPEKNDNGDVIDPNIADEIQEVYHATSDAKIIIYKYTEINANILSASIYELINVNNFISEYPQLAKEIGLPKKPQQGHYSLDEAIKGTI